VPSQVSPRRPVLGYSLADPVTSRLALLASLGSANGETEVTTSHSRELRHPQFQLQVVTDYEQRVMSRRVNMMSSWTATTGANPRVNSAESLDVIGRYEDEAYSLRYVLTHMIE
jgi:hypothetical protein